MKKVLNILIISLFIPFFVHASVVDIDENVTIKKDYNASHLSMGQTVKSESKINGINTIMGADIRHEGTSDYLVALGNFVSVNGTVENDLFLAGRDITIGSDAIVKRDLYMMGQNIRVLSNINGNIKAGGETVDLRKSTINGNVYVMAETILLDSKTTINGKLSYPENAKIEGLENAKVSKTKIIPAVSTDKETKKDMLAYHVTSYINKVLAAFIVLALLMHFAPKFKKAIEDNKLDFKEDFRLCIRGLVAIIVIPFICLFGVFTGLLTPASLILTALYIIAIYISTLVVAYKVGLILGEKLGVKSAYLSAFMGVVLICLLKVIPFIGDIVSTLAILIGLGAIYNYITTKKI